MALDAGGSQPSERWRREAAGPIYGTPATDPEGRRVFVPTTAGVIHAFDAADGRESCRFTAPRPAARTGGCGRWRPAEPYSNRSSLSFANRGSGGRSCS